MYDKWLDSNHILNKGYDRIKRKKGKRVNNRTFNFSN